MNPFFFRFQVILSDKSGNEFDDYPGSLEIVSEAFSKVELSKPPFIVENLGLFYTGTQSEVKVTFTFFNSDHQPLLTVEKSLLIQPSTQPARLELLPHESYIINESSQTSYSLFVKFGQMALLSFRILNEKGEETTASGSTSNKERIDQKSTFQIPFPVKKGKKKHFEVAFVPDNSARKLSLKISYEIQPDAPHRFVMSSLENKTKLHSGQKYTFLVQLADEQDTVFSSKNTPLQELKKLFEQYEPKFYFLENQHGLYQIIKQEKSDPISEVGVSYSLVFSGVGKQVKFGVYEASKQLQEGLISFDLTAGNKKQDLKEFLENVFNFYLQFELVDYFLSKKRDSQTIVSQQN